MAHHNSLGISRQLKIRHLLVYMGLLISRPSVFAWGREACLSTGFRCFRGKARPLQRKIVFAVASITITYRDQHQCQVIEYRSYLWFCLPPGTQTKISC